MLKGTEPIDDFSGNSLCSAVSMALAGPSCVLFSRAWSIAWNKARAPSAALPMQVGGRCSPHRRGPVTPYFGVFLSWRSYQVRRPAWLSSPSRPFLLPRLQGPATAGPVRPARQSVLGTNRLCCPSPRAGTACLGMDTAEVPFPFGSKGEIHVVRPRLTRVLCILLHRVGTR